MFDSLLPVCVLHILLFTNTLQYKADTMAFRERCSLLPRVFSPLASILLLPFRTLWRGAYSE